MCMNTKRHVCGICVKLKSLLKTHYRQVYGASLPLDIPGPIFSKPGRLTSAKFTCLICKKRFRFLSTLEAHLRNHPVSETYLNIKQEVKKEGYQDDYTDGSLAEYGVIECAVDEKPLTNHGDTNEGIQCAKFDTESNEHDKVLDSDQTIIVTDSLDSNLEVTLDSPSNEYRPTCKYCLEQFQTNELLTEHLREAHGHELGKEAPPKKNKCGYCKFETFYKHALKLHVERKHPKHADPSEKGGTQGFPCIFCQEVFTVKRHLKDHLKSTHKKRWKKSYLDILPSDNIETKVVLEKSRDGTIQTEVVPQDTQEKSIETKVAPKKRKEYKKRSEKKDPCPICHKLCRDRKAVRDHTRMVHKVLWTTLNPKIRSGERYPCPVCKKDFSKKGVRDHLNKVHKIYATKPRLESADGETYPCSVCDTVFLDKKSLQDHLKEVHQICSRYCPDGFACPLCPHRFKSVKAVRDHTRSVHKKRWNSFDEDVKEYVMKSSNLPKSVVSERDPNVEAQPPSVCNICSKSFKQPAYLRRHMRTHTGERPHACEICGQCFSFKDTLVHHLRWHRGEKPHKCTYCDRRFNSISSQRKHLLTHTREYNYSCHICGRQFLLQNALAVHLKWHSGVRNHKCDQCPKAFISGHLLKKHYRVHTGERPYVCDACGVAYRWRYNFMHHLKANHPQLLEREDSGKGTRGSNRDTTKEQTWIRYVTPDAQASTEWHNSSGYRSSTAAGSMSKRDLKSQNDAGYMGQSRMDSQNQSINIGESGFNSHNQTTGYVGQSDMDSLNEAADYIGQGGIDLQNQEYADVMGGASVKNEVNVNQSGTLNQVQLPLPNAENIFN